MVIQYIYITFSDIVDQIIKFNPKKLYSVQYFRYFNENKGQNTNL